MINPRRLLATLDTLHSWDGVVDWRLLLPRIKTDRL